MQGARFRSLLGLDSWSHREANDPIIGNDRRVGQRDETTFGAADLARALYRGSQHRRKRGLVAYEDSGGDRQKRNDSRKPDEEELPHGAKILANGSSKEAMEARARPSNFL